MVDDPNSAEGNNQTSLSQYICITVCNIGTLKSTTKTYDSKVAPTSKSESTTNSTASRAKSANTGGQHQYSAHYTGSSATDDSAKPRRPQDMSALDRLKLI